MDRASYFDEINSVPSPLLLAISVESIIRARADHSQDAIDIYLDFAQQLSQVGEPTAGTRAMFITMQCAGIESREYFEKHRESWGIPKFAEDLLTVDDFQNGFLFTFRDHSTSWGDDGEARKWFFSNSEARFARNYQFWTFDNGVEEKLLSITGDYKTILWAMIKDHRDYSALISPIFTQQELIEFYEQFDEDKDDYYKHDLLEIIRENPNW